VTSGPVEVVLFDWGGTLTPWHTVDAEAIWLAYATRYDPPRADALATRLVDAEELAWRRGRDTLRSATLHEVLVTAGVDPYDERHGAALAAYELAWEPHTLTDPDSGPLLAALRGRGIRSGLLSNTLWPRQVHERYLRRDGVLHLLDGAVYSCEIDHVKPHPEAFLAALAAAGGHDPARAVFVGDRLFDDVHGAGAVGMRTVLLPHSAIPEHQRGHTDGVPDAVVQRLADVLAVVDGWSAG
jgi:putative hydrolase of the HAD superfamily